MAKNKFWTSIETFFEGFIFWSRWVQAPMYGGLIIGAVLYLQTFFVELAHMYHQVIENEGESKIMLTLLSLVDISMVMNLVVMVTIGGYSIFASKIDVEMHEDKPLWLEGLDAGMLKIKLATSLASISGVQLLKTFVDYREAAEKAGIEGIQAEIIIHMVFIFSALLLAVTEKLIHSYAHAHHDDAHDDEHTDENGETSH
ncbi:YqhA family protein [Reichenbachiella versicolor]|uniref:YqhA family protein n=1 Tax=Reichenbachiella versicolor TaxID=1821036 RepID=UPI000D6E0A3F|nr:YqhA family protein [Reichenbachiella versicolor]